MYGFGPMVDTTVSFKEKSRVMMSNNFEGFGIIAGLMKVVTCFCMSLAILAGFAIVLKQMGDSFVGTAGYDDRLSSVIYATFNNLTFIFYVALLLTFAATMTVIMFRIKKLSFPLPPVEDLCVDFLLFTITGMATSIIAIIPNMPAWVALIGMAAMLYLPLSRLYLHTCWWLAEMPYNKKAEKKEAKKV